MDDFERRIWSQRNKQHNDAADFETWARCPIERTDPPVGRPSGDFARFVSRVIGVIPKELWRPGIIGFTPDGVMRVRFAGPKNEAGTSFLQSLRNTRDFSLTKCKVYYAEPLDGGGGFVTLSDASFAAYIGPLAALDDWLPTSIGSGRRFGEFRYHGFGGDSGLWSHSPSSVGTGQSQAYAGPDMYEGIASPLDIVRSVREAYPPPDQHEKGAGHDEPVYRGNAEIGLAASRGMIPDIDQGPTLPTDVPSLKEFALQVNKPER